MPNPENLRPQPFTSENQPANRGRPKGSLNRATIIKKWAKVKTQRKDPSTGDVIEVSLLDNAVIGQLLAAAEGNTAAFKELQDSLHGKITEKQEISGPEGAPLTVIVQGVKGDSE